MHKTRLSELSIENVLMAAEGACPLAPSIPLTLRGGRLHRGISQLVATIRHHDPACRPTVGVSLLRR
jgi:hypothetical protein